ncbi:MAG: hypothetical protein Q9183_001655 [Haloplaca sp. 2 TL-2023]
MTSRGVAICLQLLEVNARHYTVPDGAALLFAHLGCQDANDERGPLGIFLARYEDGLFRRCLSHRLSPAIDIAGSVGDRYEEAIYVAQQDNIARTTRVTWRFGFLFAELPQEISQDGVILKVIANPKNPSVSWDSGKMRLDISEGLGAAIYLGRAAGPGKLLLIGVSNDLRTRCVLPSYTESWAMYQDTESHTPRIPPSDATSEASSFDKSTTRRHHTTFRERWSRNTQRNRWDTWKILFNRLPNMDSPAPLRIELSQVGRKHLEVLMTSHPCTQDGQMINEVKFTRVG